MKITGIKKAVGDFNNWNGTAFVYFDKADGQVWTDIHCGQSWKEYEDKTIIQLLKKGSTMESGFDRTSMKDLKELVQEVQ